jgi:hypothetical protein
LQKDTEAHTESVQKRATKQIPELRHLTNERRLEILGLTTLKLRRDRGDLIQQFKFINGFKRIN